MTDSIFWDAQEELEIRWERVPSYEEVVDFLNSKFKEKDYERRTFQRAYCERHRMGSDIYYNEDINNFGNVNLVTSDSLLLG